MTLSGLLIILIILITLTVGLVIALSGSIKLSLKITILTTIISLALWQITIYVADNTNVSQLDSLVLNNLVFFWPLLAVVSMYFFTRYLKHEDRISSLGDLYSKILLFIGTALQLFSLGAGSVLTGVSKTADGVIIQRGWGYDIFIVGLVLALLALGIKLFVEYKRSARHSIERRALQMIIATTALATLFAVSTNLLIPILFSTQSFIELGYLTSIIFVIGLGFSVLKGRLLDVRVVLSRSVAYAMTLAALTLLYVLFVAALSTWITPVQQSISQSYANIVITLVLVLLFQPIKQFFDRVTNSLFFRGRYSRDVLYSRLNEVLTDTTELIALLKRSSQVIASTLSADSVFFALSDKQGACMSVGTKEKVAFIQADYDYLVRIWSKGEVQFEKDVAVRDTLSESDQDRALSRLFRSYGIQLAVPLRQSEAIIGFLFITDRKSGSYTIRDVSVIETIADELAIAIENALSIREVKLLNETLQQRIDEATTELRRSNAQLRKLDEAKDEFISMASHQLRTPLTSIKGYIDMMLDGDAGEVTPMQRQFLTEAFVSSERMVHLINDFLNVSRLQTGKFMLEKRLTDLSVVVTQEIESLKISASGRDLSFKLKLGKSIPKLRIDEAKIRQVIMNFADNALYYSKPGSSISIELKKEDGAVVFTVKDTGIGVPAEEQAHLFTKFYRAANARKQRPDGTGVGLYLAKRVVLAHGGSIVFSSTEGKGSTFGFRLPIDALSSADDTK